MHDEKERTHKANRPQTLEGRILSLTLVVGISALFLSLVAKVITLLW